MEVGMTRIAMEGDEQREAVWNHEEHVEALRRCTDAGPLTWRHSEVMPAWVDQHDQLWIAAVNPVSMRFHDPHHEGHCSFTILGDGSVQLLTRGSFVTLAGLEAEEARRRD